jgi:prepilin-type N-terminal cleavage/methylation domain-containing protein
VHGQFGYAGRAMKKHSSKGIVRAFTLIELLVVVFVFAILAAMVLPSLSGTGKQMDRFAGII